MTVKEIHNQMTTTTRLGDEPPTVETKRTIKPKFILSTPADEGSEVFCCRFSPDDQYLAASSGNGFIRIYNVSTGKQAFSLGTHESVPTTQVRWRPHQALSKTRNVLISVNADGTLAHWHATSGKCLHEIREDDNFFCVDYVQDGSQFAAAGKERIVRVYDESTKKQIAGMFGGDETDTPGHSNRIFSLKYHPLEHHLLITGGWDNTCQIWDLRKGTAVRSIYGPHICGDSVDISADGSELLTGSWRLDKQLQTWDFGTGKLIENISWRPGFPTAEPCQLYSAQFSKNNAEVLAAGGSGANEAKLFERSNTGAWTAFGTIRGMQRACYSVDFSNNDQMVAVCGGDGAVRVMNIAGRDDHQNLD